MASEEGVDGSNEPDASEEAIKDSAVFEEAGDGNLLETSTETATSKKGMPRLANLDDLSCRRLLRLRRQKQKKARAVGLTSRTVKNLFGLYVSLTSVFMSMQTVSAHSTLAKVTYFTEKVNTHFDNTINEIHHAVLASAKGDNDTYTLKQMFQQEDVGSFVEAMTQEIEDHENRNHWTLLPRSAMAEGTKTIMSVWSFKRKRLPDGRILKHKARLCAHGGMQTWGENYWETYAPVVNWLSVRTLLTLSLIQNLETRSIDFVLAFPQAELDIDVYMELPYGFQGPDSSKRYVLKLNKNLYGLKQATYNWFEMLKKGLYARGYENQSYADPCVFFGKDAIVLVYVDDCIVFSPKGSGAAEKLIKDLLEGEENFSFTDEGDLERYLGVDVKRYPDGRYELTQKHLILRFLELIDVTKETNPRPTPAINPLLHKDIDGKPRKNDWNYRQAIGMLTYLQGTSRPDISMAVHQAARFTIDPKLSHERAVHRKGKYLKGTNDKGIIFKPDELLGLECFVDASFAGGWNQADANNAESVMSRTGYVLMFAGCPLLWCSKLQTEIALSTTEAEYIALSQAMREVIPLMVYLSEINKVFPIGIQTPKVHCKVWEDNESCIAVAKNQKFSPRTKHIAIKWHHFRSFVNDGSVSINSIDTKEQTADIFTKPLDESLFKHLRFKLCGW